MRQPQWSQQGGSLDDQETIYSGQDHPTPPTIPLGDRGGWEQRRDRGFVRTAPQEGLTPTPVPQGAGAYQAPDAAQATVFIKDRPKPVFAWLVVVDGPDKSSIGTVHALHPDTTTLGRVPGNTIVLNDETCSAQHARIRIETTENKETAFVLFDMGSRNGVYIGDRNSYQAEENRKYRHELKDGDFMLIGETTLAFKTL
jgi:hypothetical protein